MRALYTILIMSGCRDVPIVTISLARSSLSENPRFSALRFAPLLSFAGNQQVSRPLPPFDSPYINNTLNKTPDIYPVSYLVCAGRGNRTPVLCLEGRYSTTKLYPQVRNEIKDLFYFFLSIASICLLHIPAIICYLTRKFYKHKNSRAYTGVIYLLLNGWKLYRHCRSAYSSFNSTKCCLSGVKSRYERILKAHKHLTHQPLKNQDADT